jgi:hypothetical protein
MQFKSYLFAVAAAATLFTACTKEETPAPTTPVAETTAKFKLEFDHDFNNVLFALNTPYVTRDNDSVTISMLRYYVTNIQLQKADGTWWSENESYYIVDASQAASLIIEVDSVPLADYKAVRYMIGVDSVRNFSGVQSGALAPSNSMFWSWNSGYIFLKLEGTTNASANGNLKFHVGGFTGANAAQAKIEHSFGTNTLRVVANSSPQVHLMVHVDKIFDGSTNIDLATINDVHMPGAAAKSVSLNIATMFEYDHIHN